jgi:hypothetical protein
LALLNKVFFYYFFIFAIYKGLLSIMNLMIA